METKDFISWCFNQHDIVCNQKYGDKHRYDDCRYPYSLHLKAVLSQYERFSHLLTDNEKQVAICGCAGHDLIEDARVTYRDIAGQIGQRVADVIYCCTEEKGRNRDERHSEQYYKELAQNEIAVFVKLCDIIANVTYSLLMNSDMYEKFQKENAKTNKYLWVERFEPMYEHLARLLTIEDTKL